MTQIYSDRQRAREQRRRNRQRRRRDIWREIEDLGPLSLIGFGCIAVIIAWLGAQILIHTA